MDVVSRLARARNTPLWVLLKRLFDRLPRSPVYALLLEQRELAGTPPAACGPAEVRVRQTDEAEIARLAEIDHRHPGKIAHFRRRFRRGDRCFLAEIDGQAAGFLWVDAGGAPIEERCGYRVRLPPRAVYAFDEFVRPEFRRRGVLTALMADLGHWMREQGRQGVVVLIEHENRVSAKVHAGLGFRPTQRIFCLRVWSARWCWEFAPRTDNRLD